MIALGVYASESLAFHRLLVVNIAHGICKALQLIPVFMAPPTLRVVWGRETAACAY